MIGLGTIINAAAIVGGGLLGLAVGKGLKPRFQESLICVMGLCVMFLGVADVMQQMLVIQDGALTTQGTMMMLASLVLGALVGEWIDLEHKLERFGVWLKQKTGSQQDGGFVDGFVTASLTVCIGAMAILGALQDGLSGDYSLLLTKAVMDLVIIMVMSASHGKGCIFSAIPVVLLQGSVTLLARLIAPVMTEQALSNLSLVGSVLIFCVGVNLTFGKRIRVANLLPAIVFAVICAFLPWF